MESILTEDIWEFAARFPLREELAGKTVLLTGATGLLGSVTARCLSALDAGIRIVAPVRDIEKARGLLADCRGIELVETDLRRLEEAVGAHIDYIIHGAAPTASKFFVEHPVETINSIVELTNVILTFSRNRGVKSAVFLSSLEVYGKISHTGKITEDMRGDVDMLDVRSSYPLAKQLAENLCVAYASEYKVPVKVARLTQTTGPGIARDDNRVIAQFTRLATHGEDIVLHTAGESARPYCYTIDTVEAILYILLKGVDGEAYNVANEDTYISARDLASFVSRTLGSRGSVKVELDDSLGYAPTTFHNLSTSRLKALGWTPRYDLERIVRNLSRYLAES